MRNNYSKFSPYDNFRRNEEESDGCDQKPGLLSLVNLKKKIKKKKKPIKKHE